MWLNLVSLFLVCFWMIKVMLEILCVDFFVGFLNVVIVVF